MTMASAMALAINGLITGNGPVDAQVVTCGIGTINPTRSRFLVLAGCRYETIEPLNTILSASTDLLQFAAAGNQSAYDKASLSSPMLCLLQPLRSLTSKV